MSKDLETFLSACSKKDYRVDFKLPEGTSEVIPEVPAIAPVVVPTPPVVAPEAPVVPEAVAE